MPNTLIASLRISVAALLMAGGVGLAVSAQTTLTYSQPLNVGPLNPHQYSPNQMFAQDMVYEGLVVFQADGTVAPWLAQSWDVSEDGRTYTFHLRPDVSFSNGEAFDASAVVKNFDTVLAHAAEHDWLDLINQLQAVRAVDPLTVELELKNPYYPLLQELALVRPVRFLAPSGFPDNGDTSTGLKAPIGTGPWKLVETALGEQDVFERNDSYWGTAPAYDRIVVKVISDPNSRAIALETGEIDLIYGADGQISPDTFARFQTMDGVYQTELSGPLETRAIALNSAQGPTADPAVRKAINHAINKDLLIQSVLLDIPTRADTLFAPTVPYADVGLAPYSYDPTLAATLLDEAGWTPGPDGIRQKDGQPLLVDFAFIGTDAVMKAIAEVIQADLLKVGIGAALLGEEPSSFYSRQTSGDFGMIYNDTWGAPYDPHAFVSSMRVPSHADYQAQLGLPDKPALDDEISRVLVSTDEAERQELYRSILTTLHDEAIYVPLIYQRAILVASPEVGGLGFGATSFHIPFEAFAPAQN